MGRRKRFLGTPATAPGPPGLSMLRRFGAIRHDPLMFLADSRAEFGDVVQFPIPRPPTYLVSHPDDVRKVLVTNAREFGKATIQYRSLARVTGDGLLAADTDAWRIQRPTVQPAFHHETLEAVASNVAQCVDELTSSWARLPVGTAVDIDDAMLRLGLDVVGRALFGAQLSHDAERLTVATLKALDVVVARARVPVRPPRWVPTPNNRRLRAAVDELDAAVDRIVSARRLDRREAAPPDMLDLLLAVRDEYGMALSTSAIRDQVVTFIVAGHETVASALTWAWVLVASDRQVQSQLQQESDLVLAGRLPELADYERLPFSRAVVDETLRLFPPAWVLTRNALQDQVLGGYPVPSGALVIISPWIVHRHPDFWTDPDLFAPGRFLDGSAPRQAFIPFGSGPRQCIGRDFAYVEATLILASIAGRFDVTMPDGARPPVGRPLVTLRPDHPVGLRFSAR